MHCIWADSTSPLPCCLLAIQQTTHYGVWWCLFSSRAGYGNKSATCLRVALWKLIYMSIPYIIGTVIHFWVRDLASSACICRVRWRSRWGLVQARLALQSPVMAISPNSHDRIALVTEVEHHGLYRSQLSRCWICAGELVCQPLCWIHQLSESGGVFHAFVLKPPI